MATLVNAKRWCSRCRRVQPLTEFYKSKRGGWESYCRSCNTQRAREYYRRRPDVYAAAQRRQAAKRPETISAQKKVLWAVKTGKLVRPTCCELCGVSVTRIQAHHSDYARPLEVVWVCGRCHHALDRRLEVHAHGNL